jgi:hypothetical protein
MLVIRVANRAEVLKDHLQARLEVGLQKRRQTGHRRAGIGFFIRVNQCNQWFNLNWSVFVWLVWFVV